MRRPTFRTHLMQMTWHMALTLLIVMSIAFVVMMSALAVLRPFVAGLD